MLGNNTTIVKRRDLNDFLVWLGFHGHLHPRIYSASTFFGEKLTFFLLQFNT